MKAPVRVEIEIVEEKKGKDGELWMTALVRGNCMAPEKNEELRNELEMMSEEIVLKGIKKFYRFGIKIPDVKWVLSLRAGKDGQGIVRIGKRPCTFKTHFGSVAVPR